MVCRVEERRGGFTGSTRGGSRKDEIESHGGYVDEVRQVGC